MSDAENMARIVSLACCEGAKSVTPLSGGMTNENYRVAMPDGDYVVRLGQNVPEHLILRANEHATSVAAANAGFSPEVIHHEPGILVIRFIDGKVLAAEDINQLNTLQRITTVLRQFHREISSHYHGYPVMFWAFHVIRHYQHILREAGSRYMDEMPALLDFAERLESDVGTVEIAFGHNDLLPANFIDDGERIWLIDFDYAGFNSPLFDLANLASNSELDEAMERELLKGYFGHEVVPDQWQSYCAMKCASLLREMVWSMVSESFSKLDVDYAAYTAENRRRFVEAESAYRARFS